MRGVTLVIHGDSIGSVGHRSPTRHIMINNILYISLLSSSWHSTQLLTTLASCGNLQPAVTSWFHGKQMSHVIHTKMGEGRRVAIPAELCQEYGLKPGTPVVLEPSESGIVLRPLDTVIKEVQAFFAGAA